MSQWADARRKLGGKNNAEPGDWHTDRNPAFQEIMDACSDPLVHEVTFMGAAQVGKTESMINNVVGYHVDQDPSSMLAIFENEKKMGAWSVERLMPMIMDTPCLRGRIDVTKGPSSGNKIEYKDFPGGFLAIANAGSEGDLSSRPVRIVLKDELDKWKMLKAGDPDSLADMRTTTYLTRKKIINLSTPRDHHPPEAVSRIMTKYESSDKRKRYVPCPFCGHFQVLRHGQLKFTRPGNAGDIVDDVWYECENPSCSIKKIRQVHFPRMRKRGKWIAEKPFTGHAGFGHYSQLYSPWVTLKQYAEMFLKSKRQRDTFKTFVNEWMGLPWDPVMEVDKDLSPYLRRREHYEKVPLGAGILTAYVDVQKDRLECEVKAWGIGRESWGLDHRIFYGEPAKLTTGHLPLVWKELEVYLAKSWEHECGALLPLNRVFIDMGYLQSEVLKFCKGKRGRGIWPSKGMSDPKAVLVTKRPVKTKDRILYFPIGPNSAKEIVFSNMATEPPAVPGESTPGFMHFNQNYDEEFFKQLLASEIGKWVKGVYVYQKIAESVRNEGLDLCVGNLAAFESMLADPAPYVEAFRRRWEEEQREKAKGNHREPEAKEPEKPAAKKSLFKNLGRVRV